MSQDKSTAGKKNRLVAALGWTRASYFLVSAFFATVVLIAIVWWPLAEEALSYFDPHRPWWVQFDWLLLGDFLVMSFLITAGADLKADSWIVVVGLVGGLVIESWGTQTELWTYYTLERPPLWIVPAWPIASLSIDRLVRLLDIGIEKKGVTFFRWTYWLVMPAFYGLMLYFVWPTMTQSLTVMALLLCAFLVATPTDYRRAVLTFAAGSGLGYFLELWGTTRACWTYYTLQTPPLFAVLAHGMAAVAFWRAELVLRQLIARLPAAAAACRARRWRRPAGKEAGNPGSRQGADC
ncbi:MAG: hypothetical protein JW900_04280 [Anaerolineae bacterium]|nr:hypothetical protein [Anaerolineae bacterium]